MESNEKKIIINAKGSKALKEAIRLVAFTKRMSSSAYIVHVLEGNPEVAAELKLHAPTPKPEAATTPAPKKAAAVKKVATKKVAAKKVKPVKKAAAKKAAPKKVATKKVKATAKKAAVKKETTQPVAAATQKKSAPGLNS